MEDKSINAGKVGLTMGGDWKSSESYEKLTCVSHNGRSWAAKKNVSAGVEPSEANSAFWQLMSDRGVQGIQGPVGPQGNSAFDGTGVEIVNNLTQGGESAVLSAEQGKVLKTELTELESKEVQNMASIGLQPYILQQIGFKPNSTTEVFLVDGSTNRYDKWAKTEPISFDGQLRFIGNIMGYNVGDVVIPGLVWLDSNDNFVGCVVPPSGENTLTAYDSTKIAIPTNAKKYVLQALTYYPDPKLGYLHIYPTFERVGLTAVYNNSFVDSCLSAIESTKLIKERILSENVAISGLKIFHVNIQKGVRYKARVNLGHVSSVLQLGTLRDEETYIDASPILQNVSEYSYEFIATENASMFGIFAHGGQSQFVLEEYNIVSVIEEVVNNRIKLSDGKNNVVCVASFDGRANESMDLTGWTEGKGLNNRDYYNLNATETPFASAAKINKYVTASNRKIIWDIDVLSNTKVCAFTQGAGLENLYAQGYCVVADFSAKTFAIHKNYGANEKGVSETLPSVLKSTTFDASIDNTSLFRIIMERVERTLKATLVYLKTNTILAELQTSFEREIVPSSGLGYDIPAITPLKGLMAIYSAKLLIPNAKPCFLYIVGDSITEGVPCQQKDCWAYKVAEIVPNTIVSGRGGGNIDGVLRKIQDEASVLKPTYVMVTIGTNGGNTPEKLSQLVNTIKAIGATPIINTIYCSSTSIQADINAQILALKEKCVRMDVATAIDNNLSEGADASLFVSDGTHLNERGNEKCYQQVLIDMPELYM